MRDNRSKWKFIVDKYNVRVDKTLSAHEVRYWKDILYKILKVGIEFELNLPKARPRCDGNDPRCQCKYLAERDCWAKCAKLEYCQATKNIMTCANRTSKCKPEQCANCEDYEFTCLGLYCNEFVPFCVVCEAFKKPCDTCEKYKVKQLAPHEVRQLLIDKFNPSGSYGHVGKGVVKITRDGSLVSDGGVEIITVGRRVNYWEFYNMSKEILDLAKAHGAYVNERCGAHMHVLAAYYGDINELEKPLPELVLANFHQLVRKYQNALTWLTMALHDPMHLTRWEKFRVSILDISPIADSMRRVVEKVTDVAGGNKYAFVNYRNCYFNKTGDIEIFHVEFREADATLCPSVYAALACLHFAFVIKAVEISRYGLLMVGGNEALKKACEMKKLILNGADRDYHGSRLGDTAAVLDHVDYFREEAVDMLSQMKNILIKLGPAYDVLEKLAYKPVALRRAEGDSWDTIENDLKVDMDETGKIEIKIDEVIDLRLVDDCFELNEWIENVTRIINEELPVEEKITVDVVNNYIKTKIKEGDFIWSEKLGAIISI